MIAIISPNNGRIHLTLADHYRENDDNDKSYEELKLKKRIEKSMVRKHEFLPITKL